MPKNWTILTDVVANYAVLAAAIKVAVAGSVHYKVIGIASDATNLYVLIEIDT